MSAAPSRQFAHLQRTSLQRLQGMVPRDCPLRVAIAERAFRVATLDDADAHEGRFQVVAAWIAGYVAAWGRA